MTKMFVGKRLAIALLASVAVVASACLGPTQFDPTGRAPIGSLDVVVDAGGGITVKGWALDPDTSAPVVVKVGSEGIVHDVRANRTRADVAAAFPGYGAAHGFEHTFTPLSPGLHGICVWVPNAAGVGDDRLLGCENVTVTDGSPIGSLDTVTSLAPRTITVGGWVFDRSTSASSEILVNVDSKFAARAVADGHRPDVGAIYGRPASGFQVQVAATPGTHQVCVAAFNVGSGSDRLLGCKNVTVADTAADRRPTGALTAVTPTGPGAFTLSGVASDPDGSVGMSVRLDLYSGNTVVQSRVLPVGGGTFGTAFSGLADGLYAVCPVGLDVPGGSPGLTGNRAFVCGSAVVGALAVGTGGSPGPATWVAPPSGSALRLVDRDAGVSAQMSDGSVMWFFGDSLEKDNAGNLKYFVQNTAAWASAGAPTVTRDGSVGGAPARFVAPASDHCVGAAYPNPAMWPESAVAVPQGGGVDRVLVFMSKVCLGDQFLEIEPRGMALVELTYDSASPPIDVPVTGTITRSNLFPASSPYGRGANLSADGTTLYGYECGRFPDEFGPCTVARVAVAQRTDPAAWRYWNGGDWTQAGSWVSSAGAAAPIQSPSGADVTVPVAAFTLTYDDAHGAWLMVYSPWPGFTDRVEVRVATTPVGPFTDPVTVFLPGCDDTTAGVHYRCYAGTAQPQLSGPGLLGLGYYDQLISPAPARGQYLVVTVPFSVVVTAGP